MNQNLLNKRQTYHIKIRQKDAIYNLKKYRQYVIAKFEQIALDNCIPEGKYKTLGTQLINNGNALQKVVDSLEIFEDTDDYAWCMAITVKTALNNSPKMISKLIKNLDKLLDLKNQSFLSEMGLNCYILILLQNSQYVLQMQNKKTLVNLYYGGKTLQHLITKVIIGYFNIHNINFHINIFSEDYFEIIKNIFEYSHQRNILVQFLTQLFISDSQFIEIYFPIFQALINMTHIYPSSNIFILWRLIVIQSGSQFVAWLIERDFIGACMNVLQEPSMDFERILAVLQCINVLFKKSQQRITFDYNLHQQCIKLGIVNDLKRLSDHNAIYAEEAQKIIEQWYETEC